MPRVRSRKREDFRTLAFGARSLFWRRSKNKRGHRTDMVEGPSDSLLWGCEHAYACTHVFMHVREGHASARRRVAHTRMTRRRANQYRTLPGVRRVRTPTVAPAETVSQPVRGRIHQPHLPSRVSYGRRRLHLFGEDTYAALYPSTQASRLASLSRCTLVYCSTSLRLEESERYGELNETKRRAQSRCAVDGKRLTIHDGE